MNIYTEVTPNPASLKFVVVDRNLLEGGTADFPTRATAEDASNLALQLFDQAFTASVFIGRNFVTITKNDGARWEDLIPVVKQTMRDYISSGAPVVHNTEAIVPNTTAVAGGDVEQKIINLIEEQVRPAVAMDGGDIIYQGFEDGVVKLQLRGSCSGCPSSMMTLKAGIQNLLTRMVPEVREVEAI